MNSKQKIEILLNGGSSPQLTHDALESLNRIAYLEARHELSHRVREIAHPEDPESKDVALDAFLREANEREHLD